MKKQDRALKMKVRQLCGLHIKAVEKAKQKATKEWKHWERFHLKSNKGVVTDATQALIQDLVKIGLLFILEGGIALQMQIVDIRKKGSGPRDTQVALGVSRDPKDQKPPGPALELSPQCLFCLKRFQSTQSIARASQSTPKALSGHPRAATEQLQSSPEQPRSLVEPSKLLRAEYTHFLLQINNNNKIYNIDHISTYKCNRGEWVEGRGGSSDTAVVSTNIAWGLAMYLERDSGKGVLQAGCRLMAVGWALVTAVSIDIVWGAATYLAIICWLCCWERGGGGGTLQAQCCLMGRAKGQGMVLSLNGVVHHGGYRRREGEGRW
ncbi:hypothetical protein B0H34DRAFT_678576 [Crassisporium funariophilum]|nr:hypothetical protein B0H34DRAFT_678576 [Crassisporium funariophilum]